MVHPGGRWSEACEMFNRMVDHGWLVDCSIYLAVLGALSHGGPWTSSLSLYEDMLRHNFRPDGVTINAVLETLWQSGVESARSKAIQLSKVASEKGIIWCEYYPSVFFPSRTVPCVGSDGMCCLPQVEFAKWQEHGVPGGGVD